MANPVPSPVLDTRDGDRVAAECVGALPAELSDRSDSNPAVALIEANAAVFDKLIYQINRWPRALVQKLLALVGITLVEATAATVTQSFTLSAPQQTDTLVPEGTQVSTEDGTVVFETSGDLTIAAYETPSGTISMTAGSSAVTGSGTSFPTGTTWEGWQIRGNGGAWYTIASVSSTTSLTLTTTATATVSGVSFDVGPVTGSVLAQATTTGVATNVGAGKLNTLVSSPAGVASTTNAEDATGGEDEETASEAVDRAPEAFSARDMVIADEDFASAATSVLGGTARAKARGGYNLTVATESYTTLALLSSTWSTASAITTAERAAVVRDLAGRTITGVTVIDVPADIQDLGATLAAVVYRRGSDDLTTRCEIAEALNGYCNPSSYPWGRTLYTQDLADVVERCSSVDRVHSINSVPCVGTGYTTSVASMTFTAGSDTVTSVGGTDYAALTVGKSFIIDAANGAPYLVTAKPTGTTLTLDRVWAGSSATISAVPYFLAADYALNAWYSLPYANLSTSRTAPPPSIVVYGVELDS